MRSAMYEVVSTNAENRFLAILSEINSDPALIPLTVSRQKLNAAIRFGRFGKVEIREGRFRF